MPENPVAATKRTPPATTATVPVAIAGCVSDVTARPVPASLPVTLTVTVVFAGVVAVSPLEVGVTSTVTVAVAVAPLASVPV